MMVHRLLLMCIVCSSSWPADCLLHRATEDLSLKTDEADYCLGALEAAELNQRRWQVVMERPFDFWFQNQWNEDGHYSVVANWLREIRNGSQRTCKGAHILHTEMVSGEAASLVDQRKNQLVTLSYLATQSPASVLNIWTGDAEEFASPPTWLAALLAHEEYGTRLRLRLFNSTDDVSKLPLSSDEVSAIQEALTGVEYEASRSDIQRYTVLYTNGGTWFDTDIIFLSDVEPILGMDFVTVTQENFLNNAVVGTASEGSTFMLETLKKSARLFQADPTSTNYFRYGPDLFEDVRNTSRQMPFRVMPGCLVDSSWVGAWTGSPSWEGFFAEEATQENLDFLESRTGPFCFHWHGHWEEDIVVGSPAEVAHASFVRKLGLD
eukprot:CAMPEP_0170573492 /NCGR_PEP_ID=MMETSP0224-20130122/2795_1 /TAXON_ID=285029 /ORGANISM="Togula jolla, Strain CCCM 725" /LENGTH=378 /DNA_ID=CAMNT_0010896085 /DNA_START=48 /DNA_END=1181 /DNA_ORIENTATION=+